MDGTLEGFPLGVNGGLPPWKQQDESWGLALPLLHFPKEKGVLPYPEPTSLDPSDLGRLLSTSWVSHSPGEPGLT